MVTKHHFALQVATEQFELDTIGCWLQDHSEKLFKLGESTVIYWHGETMTEEKKKVEKTQVSEESEKMIQELVKKNRKLLLELAKY